jgi:hypothetical protein
VNLNTRVHVTVEFMGVNLNARVHVTVEVMGGELEHESQGYCRLYGVNLNLRVCSNALSYRSVNNIRRFGGACWVLNVSKDLKHDRK